MLELYVKTQMLHTDLKQRLQRELDRTRRNDRGLSESVQTALFVVPASRSWVCSPSRSPP